MPDRFFFLHMQKTAGTSLLHHLRQVFRDDQIVPNPVHAGEAGINSDVDQLCASMTERPEAVRLVAGHFPLCTLDLIDGADFRVFTVLRDPVERTLSLLRQRQEMIDPDRTLEEIYADGQVLHGLIHNHMVKMLSLQASEMKRGMYTMMTATDDHLERAKKALVERVEVVGLQSDFASFCTRLEMKFGWDLKMDAPVRWNRTTPTPVSDWFRAHIAHDNAIDVELYQFAESLVAGRT
jgi:hypothetical protein